MNFTKLFRRSGFISLNGKPENIIKPCSLIDAHNNDFGLKTNVPSKSNCLVLKEVNSKFGVTRAVDSKMSSLRFDLFKENFVFERDITKFTVDDLTLEEYEDLCNSMEDPKKLSNAKDILNNSKGSNNNSMTYNRSFSYYPVSGNKGVPGRILNRFRNGYAVGLCGIVAFLPQGELVPEFSDDKLKTYKFFIRSIAWNDDGVPKVIVSLREEKKETPKMEASAEDMIDMLKNMKAQSNDKSKDFTEKMDKLLSIFNETNNSQEKV
jgi:hypothetical protein